MELQWLVKEFLFDCQSRNLSPKTVSGYQKQLGYFLDYLSRRHSITQLEELKPTHLKQYIVMLQKKGNKASYINDLIKPVKRICAYAFQEGYAEEIITRRVKNVKEPKVLTRWTTPDPSLKAQLYHTNPRPPVCVTGGRVLSSLFG